MAGVYCARECRICGIPFNGTCKTCRKCILIVNATDPSPAEIAEACRLIREEWTPREMERRSRKKGYERRTYRLP